MADKIIDALVELSDMSEEEKQRAREESEKTG